MKKKEKRKRAIPNPRHPMEVKLSAGQVKILGGLIAQRAEVEARIGIVVATVAAGADIEQFEGYEVNLNARTLTFGEPDALDDSPAEPPADPGEAA